MNPQVNPSTSDERSLLSSKKVYKQYSYRWVILIAFFLDTLINGIPYESCIPIAAQIHNIYSVSSSLISLTATIYMLMHPIFTFLASKLIISYGYAVSVNLGCILTALGLALRLLVNQFGFYTVILGQVLCGIARPLILNSQASMAQNWFFPKHRTAVLTAANLVQTISIVLSLIIPGNIVFASYDIENDQDYSEGKSLFFKLMFYEFLLSALLIPSLFFLRNMPQTPPSAFANTNVDIPFLEATKLLFQKRDFILTLITFSIYFGTLKGFGVVSPYLLGPFGFNQSQISLYGNEWSMPIIGGIFSSMCISQLVLKIKKYKLISIGLMIFSVIGCILFYPACLTEKTYILYSVGFFVGFFLVPLVPVVLELSCEIIYPLNGSFAVGIQYSGSTLLTVISSQILTIISGGNDSDKMDVLITCGCILGLLIVGLLAFLPVKERLNRTKEIVQRSMFKSSAFVKSGLGRTQMFSKFQQSSVFCSIGDYPTFHPVMDQSNFIANMEVFNPDYIEKLNIEQEEQQQDLQKSI